jgi:anaerobic sulfite reductase subunit C
VAAPSHEPTRGQSRRRGCANQLMQPHDYKKHGFIPQRQPGKLVMRIRSRGGNLTADDLRKVAGLAEAFGQGVVHVTTRQALEMPGVAAECFEQALREVEAAGLLSAVCGARIRPIVACPGTDTCPYGLQNARLLAEELDRQWVGRDVPAKTKIAVSGCPNSCTKPQGNDIGFKGVCEPLVDPAACIQCGLCVRRCPAQCMKIQGQTLHIDRDRCLACGRCIGLCKKGALSAGRQGFHIYIGGKGGRYPRNGDLLATFVGEKEVLARLQAILTVYRAVAEKGERLGAVVERLGLAHFEAKVKSESEQETCRT